AGMAAELVERQRELYADGSLGCRCHGETAAPERPFTKSPTEDPWPFWRPVYAAGDPLPRMTCTVGRPAHRFDEGDALPDDYKDLLIKMLRHEGERAGNKSFLGFMATCLDVAEALYPTAEARRIKAEYL